MRKVAFLKADGDPLISESSLEITPGSFAQISLTYSEVRVKMRSNCSVHLSSPPLTFRFREIHRTANVAKMGHFSLILHILDMGARWNRPQSQ